MIKSLTCTALLLAWSICVSAQQQFEYKLLATNRTMRRPRGPAAQP